MRTNHLKDTKFINSLSQVRQLEVAPGILYLSGDQQVLDYCRDNRIPVAAVEEPGGPSLHCNHILIDVDQVEDEDLENIYRRCRGIPWDIAETERTYIREFAMEDLDDLVALYARPGITDYMEPLFPYEEERAYEENYIRFIYNVYGYGMWLVFDKATDELIGRAGIETRDTCWEQGQVEMGFCIRPDRWWQGLATEVCSRIIELARDTYDKKSIICRCDPENTGSRRLLERLDFELKGLREDGDCLYLLEL